ncbi:uncharacterized protein LOC124418708 [Lucilia cuprina]|uniref:uncharacterized protein LOC124418708 n=1 Tax=Lucilia cuprina TaxID=7375 RepID=UPI001F053DCB|nr:uncharacterized protein LOC124418708 [Lucilia cuprina]
MNIKIITILFASILALSCGSDLSDFTTNVEKSTKTLGGINCLTEAAFSVENVANDFIYDIEICNAKASAVVTKLNNYSKTITHKTAKVIDADDNICNNAAYDDADASDIPSTACTNKMNTLMGNLYTAVSDTIIYLATNPAIADSCSEIAANTLKLNLPILTEAVKMCGSTSF